MNWFRSREQEDLNSNNENSDNPTDRSTIKVGELENNIEFKCRICLGLGDAESELCAPCECTGSIKYIHVTCLKEWVKEKRSIKCELCGSDYRKKWKDWAIKNRLIAGGKKGLSLNEKIKIFSKIILIVYINIVLVLSIWQYSKDSVGIKSTDITSFDKIFIKLCFGLVLFALAYNTFSYYTSSSFQKKIEDHVEKLFPHSNNEEYASNINLPVSNSIKT